MADAIAVDGGDAQTGEETVEETAAEGATGDVAASSVDRAVAVINRIAGITGMPITDTAGRN